MKLASHNTMTYLQPKHWWMKPFAFMARCQSRDIDSQIVDCGVRLVDLRIRINDLNFPAFAHGQMEYEGDNFIAVFARLKHIAESLINDKLYVMVSLEWSKKDGLEYQEKEFVKFVTWIKIFCENEPNLIICGGSRKYDWHKVEGVDLPAPPSITQMVSSTTWKIWDDWFPWLYARLMNRKNRKKQYDTEFLSLDFVQIK